MDALLVRIAERITSGADPLLSPSEALELARMAVKLGNRQMARTAHDLLWAAAGGLPSEEEFAAFEACEML